MLLFCSLSWFPLSSVVFIATDVTVVAKLLVLPLDINWCLGSLTLVLRTFILGVMSWIFLEIGSSATLACCSRKSTRSLNVSFWPLCSRWSHAVDFHLSPSLNGCLDITNIIIEGLSNITAASQKQWVGLQCCPVLRFDNSPAKDLIHIGTCDPDFITETSLQQPLCFIVSTSGVHILPATHHVSRLFESSDERLVLQWIFSKNRDNSGRK